MQIAFSIFHITYFTQFLILLTLCESSKVVLITMAAILMMSAKSATLSLLKIKLLRYKDYDILISVHDIISKFYHMTQIVL